MGAYVGMTSSLILPEYYWVVFVSVVGTCMWLLFSHFKVLGITFLPLLYCYKLRIYTHTVLCFYIKTMPFYNLVGFGGRLGTTAFISVLIVTLVASGSGVVTWQNAFLPDGNSTSYESLDVEVSLVTIASVTLTTVIIDLAREVMPEESFNNPVTAGSVVALLLMTTIYTTEYR